MSAASDAKLIAVLPSLVPTLLLAVSVAESHTSEQGSSGRQRLSVGSMLLTTAELPNLSLAGALSNGASGGKLTVAGALPSGSVQHHTLWDDMVRMHQPAAQPQP